MKKLNSFLNVVIGATGGSFIGRSICVVLDFHNHPNLYAMQSAPWYTGILVSGAVTLVVFMICFAIKAIIKKEANDRC